MTQPVPARLPQRADGLALAALLFAGLATLSAYGSTRLVASALAGLGVTGGVWQVLLWLAIAATALLFLPALRAMGESRKAAVALAIMAGSPSAGAPSPSSSWDLPAS